MKIAFLGLGLMGGFVTMLFARSAVFADPLRPKKSAGSCCSAKSPFKGTPVWRLSRRATA